MPALKHYKAGFDFWGLALFLIVMLPNFIWFAVPAPHDILRRDSITPLADTAAQAFQIIMATALCFVINTARSKPIKRGYIAGTAVCIALYFAGWAAYYAGITGPAVILDLCLVPCGAFLMFALARKNAIALISAGGFAVCHMIYGIMNFVM